MTNEFYVKGMTCQNCVRHVENALKSLPGVTNVHVNLADGKVVLKVSQPLPENLLAATIDEAGYTYAGASSQPTK
jgi:copper chaperone CopZ